MDSRYLFSVGILGFTLAGFISGFFDAFYGALIAIFAYACAEISIRLGWYDALAALHPKIIRYLTVGFANTAIDFLILNFLAASSGVQSGPLLGLFNFISFCGATTHSYFWMRAWVFKTEEKTSWKEFSVFWLVTALGGIVSSIIVWGGTTIFRESGLEGALILNGVKAVAVLLWIGWNFVGYKRFAFREQTIKSQAPNIK